MNSRPTNSEFTDSNEYINTNNGQQENISEYQREMQNSSAFPRPHCENPTRIAIPVRVEPKVFFANERTFLSWVQFAIFLGGIGTAMLGLESYRANICGIVMIFVAIVFACYALHLFFWRAERIRRREPGPYDDTRGPFLLVGMFIVALIFSVLFKFPMKGGKHLID
ncbi:nrf1 [Ecytonucleospora hepatopenaei]|uniref:Nrf1 n=1 Tax=Ecytonucleospora hepatopenaei TaxID=646526 RepID=A0A1W0E5A3_9MICR|nr:nrf1 [Ecytonucleospora hepatopenaei]